VSAVPSDADLDYASGGDIHGISAPEYTVGPQDLYTIGQVSNDGPGVLAENQASMNDYWLSAQDNAVAQSNPIKYLGAGLMRSLGNIGYGIAEMGVGLWENPGSGFTGAAKAVANFGPETFNFGVNTLKTVLDGYTLLAETAGLQEGSLQSFRDTDPFNITPLFSYDSSGESGGALLSGLVSGTAYAKLDRLSSLSNSAYNGLKATGRAFAPTAGRMAESFLDNQGLIFRVVPDGPRSVPKPGDYDFMGPLLGPDKPSLVAPNKLPKLDLSSNFKITPGRDGGYHVRYLDPNYSEIVDSSHGINAFVNKDGVLGFDIFANPELRATHGSGQDMFKSMMLRLEQDGVEHRAFVIR
jgi:hypothetical protein